MDIEIRLDAGSIGKAVDKLLRYERTIQEKTQKLCERLAFIGTWEATTGFSQAIYDGDKDFDVRVEPIENGFEIVAGGETALLLEFGAGVTYGYGHPQSAEFGMGPGTYPNAKGHWNSPHGWWFVDDMGKHHTYGNAPAMPMYNTAQDLRKMVEEVAREVFLND